MKIPRVFHHVWLGGNMPEVFRTYRQGWQVHHRDWQFVLWTESNLPPLINWSCFEDAGSASQKSDVVRYEILFRYGGVYVDTDFECLKTIEPLLSGIGAFAASENPPALGTVSVGILGCTPQHPALGQAIRELPSRYDVRRPPNVTTGPGLMSRIARHHPDFVVFGRDLFYPVPYGRKSFAFPRENAYAVHHWAASWRKQ